MTRETRFLRCRVEVREITAPERTRGYIGAVEGFIPFNSNSRQMRDAKGRPFVERLAPGVFTRSLADAGHVVLADVGHNDGAIFARRGVNLVLEERAGGLAYRALLPDTSTGRDLKTNARLRIIEGTSFEFEVRAESGKRIGEEWSHGESVAVRTIRDAILHRVNPISEPAYLGTALAAQAGEFSDTRLLGLRVAFL